MIVSRSNRSNRGVGESGFQENDGYVKASSQRIESISASSPNISHSLSDWNGMNGRKVTANPLQIFQLMASDESARFASLALGSLMWAHGSARCRIELPSWAIPMMLRKASLNRCLSIDSVADCNNNSIRSISSSCIEAS